MPPFPEEAFLAAAEKVVRANVDQIPPSSLGQLYLRPLLFGSGPILGVRGLVLGLAAQHYVVARYRNAVQAIISI